MYNIQFNFDASIPSISNVKITKVDTKTEIDYKALENPILILKDNKIWFSDEALTLLNAKAGDRITINYWNESNELTFPVIGKSELFTDKENGNRLTKSNTVSFRGTQNEILALYGQYFKLVPFNNYFKLIKITTEDSFIEEESSLNNLK